MPADPCFVQTRACLIYEPLPGALLRNRNCAVTMAVLTASSNRAYFIAYKVVDIKVDSLDLSQYPRRMALKRSHE